MEVALEDKYLSIATIRSDVAIIARGEINMHFK